jgi:hypothetical protein
MTWTSGFEKLNRCWVGADQPSYEDMHMYTLIVKLVYEVIYLSESSHYISII